MVISSEDADRVVSAIRTAAVTQAAATLLAARRTAGDYSEAPIRSVRDANEIWEEAE